MPTARAAVSSTTGRSPSAPRPTRTPVRAPEPLERLLRRALRALKQNDGARALRIMEVAFNGLTPHSAYAEEARLPQAFALLAHASFLQGETTRAFRILRKVRRQFPDDARFPALAARMHLQLGHERAAAIAARAALHRAANADANLVLAELARRADDTTKALEHCHAALEIERNRWEAYAVLAETLIGQGWLEDAVQFLQVAVRRVARGSRREALWKLARTAAHARNFELAERVLRQLLVAAPDNERVDLYVALSEVCGQTQRANDALTFARKALELNPRNLDGLSALLAANVQKGSYNEAVRAAEAAVELAPTDPFNRFKLGVLLNQSGNLHGAVEQYSLLVALNPDTPLAEAAAEALANIEQFQFQQIMLRCSEDSVFRLKLRQNTEATLVEYGYVASLGLLSILRSNEVDQLLQLQSGDKPVRYH